MLRRYRHEARLTVARARQGPAEAEQEKGKKTLSPARGQRTGSSPDPTPAGVLVREVMLLPCCCCCHCFTELAWAIRLVIVWVRPRQGPETTKSDAGSDLLSVRARLVSPLGIQGWSPSGVLHPQSPDAHQHSPTRSHKLPHVRPARGPPLPGFFKSPPSSGHHAGDRRCRVALGVALGGRWCRITAELATGGLIFAIRRDGSPPLHPLPPSTPTTSRAGQPAEAPRKGKKGKGKSDRSRKSQDVSEPNHSYHSSATDRPPTPPRIAQVVLGKACSNDLRRRLVHLAHTPAGQSVSQSASQLGSPWALAGWDEHIVMPAAPSEPRLSRAALFLVPLANACRRAAVRTPTRSTRSTRPGGPVSRSSTTGFAPRARPWWMHTFLCCHGVGTFSLVRQMPTARALVETTK